MKKLGLLTLMGALLLTVGCDDDPAPVAETYNDAFIKKDTERVLSTCAFDSKADEQQFRQAFEKIPESDLKAYEGLIKGATFFSEINGETADIFYTKHGKKQFFCHAKRVNGEWKLILPKP